MTPRRSAVVATLLLMILLSGCSITTGGRPNAHDRAAEALLGDHEYELSSRERPSRADLQLAAEDTIVIYGAPDDEPFRLSVSAGGETLAADARYLNVLCQPGTDQRIEVDSTVLTVDELQNDLSATARLGVPRRTIDAALAKVRRFEKSGDTTDFVTWLSAPTADPDGTFQIQIRISNDLSRRGLTYAMSWPGECRNR